MLRAQLRPQLSSNSSQSNFCGQPRSLQPLRRCSPSDRSSPLLVQASKVCDLTGKQANNGFNVTFSHKRNHRKQYANLQTRKLYWTEGARWVHMKVCTKAIRTVELKGLQKVAKDNGVDLTKFPYTDMSKNRRDWLAAREEINPPMNKEWMGNSRKMKNPEKLAASRKQPLVARYLAGRVVLRRQEQPTP